MLSKRLLVTVGLAAAVLVAVPVATAFGSSASPVASGPRFLAAATPLGDGFAYQGRLSEGGQPANGTYDLRFIAYDAEPGGTQVGTTETKEDVQVVNGLFTVTLNFGAGVFNGDARWLDIAVRHGNETGIFTTLSPRQPISSSPYSLYAKAAGSIAVPFSATGSTASGTDLIELTQNGTGAALSVTRATTASTNPAISATNVGSGAGLYGESTYAGGGAIGVAGQALGAQGVGGWFKGTTGLQVDGPIKVSGSNPAAFVQIATVANIAAATNCVGNCTLISNPLIDGDSTAILIITQRWTILDTDTGVYNNKSVGVWYDPDLGKWTIFNEDAAAMPPNARFNVLVIKVAAP